MCPEMQIKVNTGINKKDWKKWLGLAEAWGLEEKMGVIYIMYWTLFSHVNLGEV